MIMHLSKEIEGFIKGTGHIFYHENGDIYIRPADVWYKQLGNNNFEVIFNSKELTEINKEIIINAIKKL